MYICELSKAFNYTVSAVVFALASTCIFRAQSNCQFHKVHLANHSPYRMSHDRGCCQASAFVVTQEAFTGLNRMYTDRLESGDSSYILGPRALAVS